jgi:transcriptional regulator with XRE-family HTH domain
MSYLSDEIQRQIDEYGVTGQQVAVKMGLSVSQIYNWIRGDQTTINERNLCALQAALSSDSNAHARLVLAHLLDEKFGHGNDRIAVELKADFEIKDAPRIKARGEKALHFLSELRMKSKDCNDLLIDLAKVLGADL